MSYETEKLLRCEEHPEQLEFDKVTTVETRVDHMGRAFKTDGKRKQVRSKRSIIYVCPECDDIVHKAQVYKRIGGRWIPSEER